MEVFMKNTIKLFGIIILVAIIGFSFAACDDGSGDNGGGNGGGGGNSIVAIWWTSQALANADGIPSINGYALEFRSDGRLIINGSATQYYTYTANGGILTVTWTGSTTGNTVTGSSSYSINGTALTINSNISTFISAGTYYKKNK
jgi:hypothetical protein